MFIKVNEILNQVINSGPFRFVNRVLLVFVRFGIYVFTYRARGAR